jgi:glucose-1-phosphate adenylyltransferase
VLISGGCIVIGSNIRRSVLFSNVRVESCCTVARGGDHARHRDRPRLAPVQGGIDRGCQHPRGHGDRRGRGRRRAALPSLRGGVVLVTKEMLAQAAGEG